jgi:GNAT superfamily N-acetyltransferase
LTFGAVDLADRADADALFAIYEASIPARERRTRAAVTDLARQGRYRIHGAWHEGALVAAAVIFDCESAGVSLLDYLFSREDMRGSGLGAALFSAVAGTLGDRRLLVEVDSEREASADRAIRKRRKDFYRRLGCRQFVGLPYILPLPGDGDPPLMDLLVLGEGRDAVATAEVRDWLLAMIGEAYPDVAAGNLVSRMLDGLGPSIPLD